uniref:RAVE complex protein Rav1 C-terminal domain-containing protein n=1 Tax=Hyaloperonospora arabidopsidis (strain Emoy2) TaxID=559515 RepID=M4BC99_HYAAE
MAQRVRAWSWTRLDGRNVLAMPTRTEIRLYDSDEFMLLSRLTPSGHRSPVAFVRWSAFHGKLASLSAEQIVVHAPQRDGQHHQQQQSSSVPFVVVCCFPLDVVHTNIRSLAFSRNATELLFCGRHVGQIGKIDVRGNQDADRDHALVLWQVEEPGIDVAKYSPSAFVFATLRTNERAVQVWRMKRRVGEADDEQTLDRVETLSHAVPVVFLSWKPARTQWHSALESDGTTKAQWFEPARILLTCTVTRAVCIWTEREDERDGVCFNCVLTVAPTCLMHNVRWVVSKNRNISEENGVDATTDVLGEHAEWISGVDPTGVLRLWKLVGVTTSTSPTVEETSLEIQVYGEDDRRDVNMDVGIADVCVMAYFSQNYTGMPSKLGIVLQRMDHIIMSFHIAVGEGDQPSHVVKKSWYRSHLGSISALSAHPSLPLIASVDAHTSECDGTRRYDVLVYWISFSAFSAESRLIPSGVLPCDKDSGNVLCVQWVPTLHFDATPLFLVVFDSGVIDVYSRSAEADVSVVSSPRLQLPRQQQQERTCSSSPSGSEYEVSCGKPSSLVPDIEFKENEGKLIVRRNSSSNKYLRDVVVGDELVGINNESVVGKKVKDILALFDSILPGAALLMRFRVVGALNNLKTIGPAIHKTASDSTVSVPFQPTFSSGEDLNDPKHTVEEHQQYVTSSLENHNLHNPHGIDNMVRVGAVSMYGGWKQMFHRKVQRALSLLCVCPFYADDGEYVPNSVLIFGIESIPGKLCMWKGVRDGTDGSFELLPLQVQDVAMKKKANITAIAGERDYRQRAFSSKRAQGRNSLNSLIFIGDAAGFIEHWRCQVTGNSIHFTMMSSHLVCGSDNVSSLDGHPTPESLGPFCRRGYVYADRVTGSSQSGDAAMVAGSVGHIEVDDPNRLAVLRVDRPDELHIFEAESGLGILRAEESITSNGRGDILGFNWCNSHVEFNIDALAVRYEHATVMYQYDTTLYRWSQIGDDIVSPLPLFDCTRDSSALLVGGGNRKDVQLDQSSFEPITNEMPVVLGKWDEPGSHLQRSMDWKAAESPQKLPMWHPYVLLTTMFGMHARVGEKDTLLAGDRASYAFSRAFSDATQMLKLLARVLQDKHSAQASASTGVFSYTSPEQAPGAAAKQAEPGRVRGLDYVGRYSTLIHRSDEIDKAENLFAAPVSNSSRRRQTFDQDKSYLDEEDHRTLAPDEAAVIVGAVNSMLLGKVHSLQANASVLFASFGEEHLLETKALLSFVDVIQSLGFDLDASAADLGAKRYFSMCLFAKSLRSVVRAHVGNCTSNPQNGDPDPFPAELKWRNMHSEREDCSWLPSLEETPSSGLLWALHSDAQQFLWEHCIEPGMLWDDIRPQWLGLWIKDVQDLRGIVERSVQFAKFSYMRSKDAMEVCLLYVALGKKNVLSALAKISQSQSNKRLASFLDNDFSEKYWSNAAIKNAYSLLSKKQYKAAASFFLLCEPPRIQDAIRVLSNTGSTTTMRLIVKPGSHRQGSPRNSCWNKTYCLFFAESVMCG